jgi:glycosyltransferase involved in cell wall biosynthesis/polysaccharide pyruvyl transferase WcaK-like protein
MAKNSALGKKKNIFLFFGHVASNIGDLAINTGELELLQAAYPNASITVVFFGDNANYINNSIASCGSKLANIFIFKPSLEKALKYLADPVEFLRHTGAKDADIVFLASGEYYFSYKDNPNDEILFWRTLPIVAAKKNNQDVIVLPSTFGPFETDTSAKLMQSVLSITDAHSARESASRKVLEKAKLTHKAHLMLDPAFFINTANLKTSVDENCPQGHLAISMRSETMGMRLANKTVRAGGKINVANQLSYQFTLDLCQQYLEAEEGNVVVLYIQTIADKKLGEAIAAKVAETYNPARIKLIRPNTVDEYLSYLARASFVVASRFHALILALTLGKPVFGTAFGVHGHKIPGLFDMFGIKPWYSELTTETVMVTVEMALQKILSSNRFPKTVFEKIESEKEATLKWLVEMKPSQHNQNKIIEIGELFSNAYFPHFMAKTQDELGLQKEQLALQKGEINKLKKLNAGQKLKISLLRVDIKTLKGSISFRVGQQIVKDARRPLHWPLLPIKLLRIYKQRLKYRSFTSKTTPRNKSADSQANLESLITLLSPKKITPIETIDKRICYVLHNSLPYASGGYATRAHGLSKGLKASGYDVFALTRPGFPVDTIDIDVENISDHEIDGIKYLRDMSGFRKGQPTHSYMEKIIDVFEARFREIKPSMVIAASFPLSAMPAIIAAKRLGIPVIYELRGLEEITKLSRDKNYADTEEFFSKVRVETATAIAADHVFTLTGAMREELIQRGVDNSQITLLPNSCDSDNFLPIRRDARLSESYNIPHDVPVIGYIGSIVFYEGLEVLINACGILKKEGVEFRLLIVGSEHSSTSNVGPTTQAIQKAADKNNLNDWLIMPGRIPHEEVQSHYSLIDIAPFPRKALPVCEMVSPMKPLEAMAMEKAVIVSSVKALTEMVQNDETGLVFEKGNTMSLAKALHKLIIDPGLRTRLGKKARTFVLNERSWQATASIGADKIKSLMGKTISNKNLPAWWSQIDPTFAEKCGYVAIKDWELSDATQKLKKIYIDRYDEASINRRIPLSNWKRADICWQKTPKDLSTIDIGSGLGEFINLFAINNEGTPIASVDTRDWDKYFDHTGRIQRIYKNIFDLGDEEVTDVVTCFEVIEHLPPERVAEAVSILRKLARKKLFISVPFLEPLPLYKGHFTRFTETNLLELMPDAQFTVFAKGTTNKQKVHAWILAEIDVK